MHIYQVTVIIDRWTRNDHLNDYFDRDKKTEPTRMDFLGFINIVDYLNKPPYVLDDYELIEIKHSLTTALSYGDCYSDDCDKLRCDYHNIEHPAIYMYPVELPAINTHSGYEFNCCRFYIFGYKFDNNGQCFFASSVDLPKLFSLIDPEFSKNCGLVEISYKHESLKDVEDFHKSISKAANFVDRIFKMCGYRIQSTYVRNK